MEVSELREVTADMLLCFSTLIIYTNRYVGKSTFKSVIKVSVHTDDVHIHR